VTATASATDSSDGGTSESSGADGTAGSTSGGASGTCGWDDLEAYYACGLSGADPSGQVPIDCPEGLVEGGPCTGLDLIGCCDANGDNWYCEGEVAVFDDC
jgi:hypothetical protein